MRQEFLEQFKGKGADDAFIIGKDIDAVTGATVSSEAVADILKICLERLGKKPSVPLVTELKKSGIEPREAKYYKVIE
ncbi:MAG: FMN-binding protein, partial [Candidatus Omnitrophica bacterium]|nr:FMN-binding protein [Candidatus Omnitrophota bacterium]